MTTITEIQRREVANGKYSYTIVYSDGSAEVWHKKSSRLYDVAQEYAPIRGTPGPLTLGKSIQYPQYWTHVRTIQIVAA